MTTKALSLLCLAASLAAPVCAQTIEEVKTVSDRPIISLDVPKLRDVCFGRGRTVAAVREGIEKAEKGVAAKTMSVGEGVDAVMKSVGDGNGQCAAKTILTYLGEKGDLAASLTIDDNGKTVSILLSTNGGPVLFKGASESGAYAFQVLTYRLQRIAQPAETDGRGGCSSYSGKDADQMQSGCQRHGWVKDAEGDAEVARPAPADGSYRGGKDADQMSSGFRGDPHE